MGKRLLNFLITHALFEGFAEDFVYNPAANKVL